MQVSPDCNVGPAKYRALGDFVDPRSWDFSWWLEFTDNHYIVCHEIWSCRPGKGPVRHFFSFDYGPIAGKDAKGNIDRSPRNPLVLRICKNNREPAHLHFKHPHPHPHYEQNRIQGLVLDNVDMFQFVKAVRSRAEGIELDRAMGFALR